MIPIVSADSHIIEPPDLWTQRIEPKYRERAPRVVREDGADFWVVDGTKLGSVTGRRKRSGSIGQGSVRSKGGLLTHSTFENTERNLHDPTLYVETNEQDGVVYSVVRPTQGIIQFCIADKALLAAACRAENDWLADFCGAHPDRMGACALIDVHDIDWAVSELQRCRRNGHVAAIIPIYPGEEINYSHPRYEPLWAAAVDQQMPISLHVLTNHDGPYGVPFSRVSYARRATADAWPRLTIADMLFAGVFDRHPEVRVESSENEGGWMPYFMWQLDWIYDNRILKRRQQSPIERRPSEYLRENIYLSLIYDRPMIEQRHTFGVDRIMWGSDYPHEQSTHPRSQAFLAELMHGVPESEVRKMVQTNAIEFFHLDLKASLLETPAPV